MDDTLDNALAAPSTSVLQHPLTTDSREAGSKAALARAAEAMASGDADTKALAEILVLTLIEEAVVAEVDGHLAEFMDDLRQAVRSFEEALD